MAKPLLQDDLLATPVQFVKGVGPYLASVLEKKGIKTVYDLFYYFPIRYLDRRKIDSIRNLTPGKEKCVAATVVGCGIRPLRNSRRRIFEMDSYTEVLKNSKSSHFLDEAPITENRQVKEKVIHHKDQVIESDQVTDNFEEPFEE